MRKPVDICRLVIDSLVGIYIPQSFVTAFETVLTDVDKESIEILKAGPNHEDYWEVWEELESHTSIIDVDGNEWTLYHNNDLFLIRKDITEQEFNSLFFG